MKEFDYYVDSFILFFTFEIPFKASKEFGIPVPSLLMPNETDSVNRINLSGCEDALERFKSAFESHPSTENKVTHKSFLPY